MRCSLITRISRLRFCFGNRLELLALSRALGWPSSSTGARDSADTAALAAKLAALMRPEGYAVITGGADATVIAQNGCGPPQEFPTPAVPAGEVTRIKS